ncbi:sensor histidine kinase [Noviherbaspirillum pedocola]|uniref:histidine kinase n=1 Tax=Noviherbaspirillum pedocola TaxID=2801341 RepID=A0A934W970_9BURK|nr:ATP-binding protein [Noviherbaspirillum pedocola]MBK4738460.1 hypothetical protein [Noviherbaspirillum pedocola]
MRGQQDADLQQTLQEANRTVDELRERATKLEHELQKQRMQVSFLARSSMLGELSGAFAHELTQPLTAISYNVKAAQRGFVNEATCPEELRRILESITADASRAIATIQRLRSLFMKHTPRHDPVDLNELLSESENLVRTHLGAHGVKLTRRLHKGMLRVRGDSVQLLQVLVNLILNACDSMKGTPPELRMLTLESRSLGPRSASISITDNGTGIAADAVGHLFDPYFTTKPNGTGFGLSISRAIISSHGGHIEAFNNPGRGATFRIVFPAEAHTAMDSPGKSLESL